MIWFFYVYSSHPFGFGAEITLPGLHHSILLGVSKERRDRSGTGRTQLATVTREVWHEAALNLKVGVWEVFFLFFFFLWWQTTFFLWWVLVLSLCQLRPWFEAVVGDTASTATGFLVEKPQQLWSWNLFFKQWFHFIGSSWVNGFCHLESEHIWRNF